MKEYFISLLAVGVLSMLANALCADEKGGDFMSKNIRLFCALAVICVIVAPLKEFITTLSSADYSISGLTGDSDIEDYEDKYKNALISSGEESVKSNIQTMLAEKFGMSPDNIRIELEIDRSSSSPNLTKVIVFLSKTAIFKNPYDIEKAVSDTYGCECDVAVE